MNRVQIDRRTLARTERAARRRRLRDEDLDTAAARPSRVLAEARAALADADRFLRDGAE